MAIVLGVPNFRIFTVIQLRILLRLVINGFIEVYHLSNKVEYFDLKGVLQPIEMKCLCITSKYLNDTIDLMSGNNILCKTTQRTFEELKPILLCNNLVTRTFHLQTKCDHDRPFNLEIRWMNDPRFHGPSTVFQNRGE